MPTFPSLNSYPTIADWSEQRAIDPTIRTQLEAGYVQTRPRFTRIPRKYGVKYVDLSQSDKETLFNFETQVKVGADSFTWNDPHAGSTDLTVRFAGPIRYGHNETQAVWTAEFELEEV